MNQESILRFFEITGSEKDSLVFLNKFKSLPPESFALIAPDERTVSESIEIIFQDLRFLKEIGLSPVLFLQKDSFDYIQLFYSGLLEPKEGTGFSVDIIYQLNEYRDSIIRAISNKKIPVLVAPGNDFFENLFLASSSLFTNKILYLVPEGGIRNLKTDKKINLINLQLDSLNLLESGVLSEKDSELLKKIIKFFDINLRENLSFAITSPRSVFKELFTVKGSGTFIKKGSEIKFHSRLDEIDKLKLISLLESAFQKKIKTNFLDSGIHSILIETRYRGAAIFKTTKYGMLLSKFAVDEIARGEGIGRDIWDKMRKEFPIVFWRAKPFNFINKWYAKECDGFMRFQDWVVYWIGLKVEDVPEIIKYLLSIPPDFYEEEIPYDIFEI
jgi:acetylglutamate kinase